MKSLQSQLQAIFKAEVLPILVENANQDFITIKEYILNSVKTHPVCRELESKSVPSQFLNSGSSTLFGFMGFEAESDPVQDLLNFLEQTITQRVSVKISKFEMVSSVNLPSKTAMNKERSLQLPWLKGISWPIALEIGIPHFESFIGKEGIGRSELGIQAKVKGTKIPQIVRDAEMEPVDFLTPIFAEAKRK